MGMLLLKVGDRLGAIEVMKRLVQLNPSSESAYFNLGSLQINTGDYAGAELTFRKAAKKFPKALEWDLHRAATLLPEIVESAEQIQEKIQSVETLIAELESSKKIVWDIENIRGNFFPIAYYGISTLGIQKRVSRLLLDRLKSPRIPTLKSPSENVQRIGFISGLMRDHTIGKLNEGLIEFIDRKKFQVVLIHLASSTTDAFSTRLNELADEVIYLSTNTRDCIQRIAEQQLDILHYLDIGMNAFTHRLAHFRLAPFQTTSWGHPVSTGIPTIDYFISFDKAESEIADSQYSETLIRFEHPPVFYRNIEHSTVNHSEIPELPDGRLYGCLQSLFKIHPEFDKQLERILLIDESATLVFVEAENSLQTEALRARWQRTAPVLNNRSLFLSRMRREVFMEVVRAMDVLLDPPHFGSGNTLYESLAIGMPSVTWKGPFMRGRITAGLYEYMGIENPPVVDELSNYAEISVELASDRVRLAELKQDIAIKSDILYENSRVIAEFENFFSKLVSRER